MFPGTNDGGTQILWKPRKSMPATYHVMEDRQERATAGRGIEASALVRERITEKHIGHTKAVFHPVKDPTGRLDSACRGIAVEKTSRRGGSNMSVVGKTRLRVSREELSGETYGRSQRRGSRSRVTHMSQRRVPPTERRRVRGSSNTTAHSGAKVRCRDVTSW